MNEAITQEPPLSIEIHLLSGTKNCIHETIGKLKEKLNPVLSSEDVNQTTADEPSKAVHNGTSEAVKMLKETREELNALNNDLCRLIQLIEV